MELYYLSLDRDRRDGLGAKMVQSIRKRRRRAGRVAGPDALVGNALTMQKCSSAGPGSSSRDPRRQLRWR